MLNNDPENYVKIQKEFESKAEELIEALDKTDVPNTLKIDILYALAALLEDATSDFDDDDEVEDEDDDEEYA